MNSISFCEYYNRKECFSCTEIEIPYTEQLLKKESVLREALALPGTFLLQPSVASPTLGFRNKAKLSVTGTTTHPILGLTGKAKLDAGREILSCPIHHPKLNRLIEALPAYIQNYNLIPYSIETKTGELKSIILFYSEGSDELYLRFVLRSKECISRIQKLLPKLQADFPGLACVSANLQPIPHAILEGPEEIFITEKKFITHRLDVISLKLSPQAFVQTNAVVATQLYQTAAKWISEIKPESMVELFCGQGPFSFFAAQSAKKIIGLEINAAAVKTANDTARDLGFTHLEFQCVDAAQTSEAMKQAHANLVLVNPPRRGLGPEVLTILKNERPANLIYSSCSVESLASDLKALSELYQIKRAQIFDLFPHTAHFETLVHLEKNNGGR
jgi:23S rRNA (uracil747-C5)-methyltransferase